MHKLPVGNYCRPANIRNDHLPVSPDSRFAPAWFSATAQIRMPGKIPIRMGNSEISCEISDVHSPRPTACCLPTKLKVVHTTPPLRPTDLTGQDDDIHQPRHEREAIFTPYFARRCPPDGVSSIRGDIVVRMPPRIEDLLRVNLGHSLDVWPSHTEISHRRCRLDRRCRVPSRPEAVLARR